MNLMVLQYLSAFGLNREVMPGLSTESLVSMYCKCRDGWRVASAFNFMASLNQSWFFTILHWNWKINSSTKQVSHTRLSLSLLVSPPCSDGRLWGAPNELLIRLIRQQTKCGDVFGLQVTPRAPLTLWSLCRTSQWSHLFLQQMLIGPWGARRGCLTATTGRRSCCSEISPVFPSSRVHVLTVGCYKVCTEHIKLCGTILRLLLAAPERCFTLILHHKMLKCENFKHGFLISWCCYCLAVIEVHRGCAKHYSMR